MRLEMKAPGFSAQGHAWSCSFSLLCLSFNSLLSWAERRRRERKRESKVLSEKICSLRRTRRDSGCKIELRTGEMRLWDACSLAKSWTEQMYSVLRKHQQMPATTASLSLSFSPDFFLLSSLPLLSVESRAGNWMSPTRNKRTGRGGMREYNKWHWWRQRREGAEWVQSTNQRSSSVTVHLLPGKQITKRWPRDVLTLWPALKAGPL